MRVHERLILGLLAWLPQLAAAQEVVGVVVEPNRALVGQPVNITIHIDRRGKSQFTCGLAISLGDNNAREIRVSENEIPLRMTHSYTGTGSYTISAEGKTMIRGFNSALGCGGGGRATVAVGQAAGGYQPQYAPQPAGRDYTASQRAAAPAQNPFAAPTQAASCAREVMLYTNGNGAGVVNNPSQPTRFNLGAAAQLSTLMTYHWNNGRGQPGGMVALLHQDGTRYGPWQVVTAPGQGGVPNAYWNAHPNVVLKPGVYTVQDSDPASWAQNAQSGGQGMVEVKGCAAGSAPPPEAGREYTARERIAAPAQGNIDPVGVWRHHPEATWTISRTPDGRYFGQEQGLGNAAGPAYWTPSGTLRIDYVTRDGSIKGYYEVRFTPDGRSASGNVRELNGPMRTGSTSWVKQQAPGGGRAYTAMDRPRADAAQAGRLPVTIYWHMADDADVYLNGQPLRRYEPSFRTRGDEAPQPAFSAQATLRNGDVFTVGGRRGGSFGFMLIAVDAAGRVIFKTDPSWQVYAPGDRADWYQPAVANSAPKTPVTVQPDPWYPQKELNKKYGNPAQSVWGAPSSQFSYLTRTVSGLAGGGSAPALATQASGCARETMLYTNGNGAGVGNGPTQPTRFMLASPSLLTTLMTYHWNNGRGQPGGMVALLHQDGTRYGPWQVATAPGQGGVPNAYWNAHPNVVLKPGAYTVQDSDPGSWAQNGQSGGQGMVEVKGCVQTASAAPDSGRDYTAVERESAVPMRSNSRK